MSEGQAVRDCLQAFVSRDYASCVSHCRALLLSGRLRFFVVLPVMLISLEQLGETAALEAQELEILRLTAHIPYYQALVKLAIGKQTLPEVLALARYADQSCQAHYYAGARFLTLGDVAEAQAALTACLAIQVECPEWHLARAQSVPSMQDASW